MESPQAAKALLESLCPELVSLLEEKQKLAIAFSGGVDSAFLLASACAVLGRKNVLALTADSVLVPSQDRDRAKSIAGEIGVEHLFVPFDPLTISKVANNDPKRCYFCKKALFAALIETAKKQGFYAVADGTNVDDRAVYRPGLQALEELDIFSPLKDAGLGKAAIRTLSQALGLSTWDAPSAACLASRVPYHVPLNEQTLARIAQAEKGLFALGFTQVRVRCHNEVARIEVPSEQIDLLLNPTMRAEVVKVLRSAGFAFVTADLEGFRSGSFDGAF